jgi:hypothetical protein
VALAPPVVAAAGPEVIVFPPAAAQKLAYHAWIDVISPVSVHAASQTPDTPVEKGASAACEQKQLS